MKVIFDIFNGNVGAWREEEVTVTNLEELVEAYNYCNTEFEEVCSVSDNDWADIGDLRNYEK
jgi:hypothetical protein